MALSIAYSVHATFIKSHSHLPFNSPFDEFVRDPHRAARQISQSGGVKRREMRRGYIDHRNEGAARRPGRGKDVRR